MVFLPCRSENSLLGRAVIFWGKVYSSRERIASFPEGEQLPGYGWESELGLLAELIMILVILLAWLLGRLLSSDERWTVAGRELLPSLGGRRAVARVGLQELWGACLFIGLVMLFTALARVTFPSFLDTNWFNLFICLCFTLMNLSSLTLFMKSWHSPSLFCRDDWS